MAIHQIVRYVRPYAEAKENMLDRLRRGSFEFTEYEVAAAVFDRLTSLDRDAWAAAFMEVARPYEERAQEAEARGDIAAAQQDYLRAYGYYRLGRYPAPNSPGKRASYQRSVQNYLRAAPWFDPPLERVEIPFQGRPGGGDRVIGYFRRPPSPLPSPPGGSRESEGIPILVGWGGIDGFKEELRADAYLARGIAVLALDNAGVGEAPIAGSEDAERMWDAVLDRKSVV